MTDVIAPHPMPMQMQRVLSAVVVLEHQLDNIAFVESLNIIAEVFFFFFVCVQKFLLDWSTWLLDNCCNRLSEAGSASDILLKWKKHGLVAFGSWPCINQNGSNTTHGNTKIQQY